MNAHILSHVSLQLIQTWLYEKVW